MTAIDKHEPGTFCWVELATMDMTAAIPFYSKVFGWDADTNSMPEGGDYTTFRISGERSVGGGYVQPEPEREQAIPPHWNLYVYTDDVDKTVARVEELGGKAIVAGMDLGMGRMGVFADPTGAALSVWQSEQMPGFAVKGEHGAYVWAELATNDTGAAAAFYRDLFGWQPENQGEEFGNYTLFKRGDQGEAGMMTPPDQSMPNVWIAYFAVDDTDATAEAVTAAGGTVEVPPMDIPTVGRFAVFSDPQGAVFAVITAEQEFGRR